MAQIRAENVKCLFPRWYYSYFFFIKIDEKYEFFQLTLSLSMGGKLKKNIFTRLMSKISELCLGTRMEINTFGKERDVYILAKTLDSII